MSALHPINGQMGVRVGVGRPGCLPCLVGVLLLFSGGVMTKAQDQGVTEGVMVGSAHPTNFNASSSELCDYLIQYTEGFGFSLA